MTETVVRIATREDELGILNLCRLMHAEQGQHPMNWQKVIARVRAATDRKNGVVGVIGPSDDIQAHIYLLIDEIYYSDECQILEIWNFVRPDCRRSNYAKTLIEFAKKCARDMNLHLMIGVLSDIRMEAKVRLYERQLPKAGAFFLYRPEADGVMGGDNRV